MFIRGRKLNISIVFITQSYSKVPKDVRLNSTHFFLMKIANKRELEQIALNHSSDIIKIYKKCTVEPYSFLVNDTTLPSDDPLIFRKNLFKIICNKIMTIEDQIRDEKLQNNINREAAKISALASGKIDKYEHLIGEEILPSNQQQTIEQPKFTYSPLGKAFEEQIKAIKEQGEKQVKAIQDKEFNKSMKKLEYGSDDDPMLLKQKEIYSELTEEKKDEIEKLDKTVNRIELLYKYRSNTSDVDFSEYYGAIDLINKIKNGDVSLKKAVNDQYELKSKLGEIKKGNPKRKSKTNSDVIKNVDKLYDSRQAAINFFIEYTERISEAKSREKQEGTGLKILTPKLMLQRLPIALAKIKAGNNSDSLLNEIRQIVYFLYRSKEITKKVNNNIIKSRKV